MVSGTGLPVRQNCTGRSSSQSARSRCNRQLSRSNQTPIFMSMRVIAQSPVDSTDYDPVQAAVLGIASEEAPGREPSKRPARALCEHE
jgi:hypothetical protein